MRLALIFALALSACATVQQPLIVSGASLDAVGKEFKATGEAFYAGCSTGRLPAPTCAAWADFADRFKPSYRAAVTAWSAGAALGVPGDAGIDWPYLVGQLAVFTAQVVAVFNVDGGAP